MHANNSFFRASLADCCCCMFVVFASTLLVRKINPSLEEDLEISLFIEGKRQKYSIKSIISLALVCLVLYILTIGSSIWSWIYFYIYASILAFRVITFLQAHVPTNMKPFPYLNKNSSALMVFCTLWSLEVSNIKLSHLLFCILVV